MVAKEKFEKRRERKLVAGPRGVRPTDASAAHRHSLVGGKASQKTELRAEKRSTGNKEGGGAPAARPE